MKVREKEACVFDAHQAESDDYCIEDWGKVRWRKGQWILKQRGSVMHVASDEEFRKEYEEIA